jgi:hypothetical protein
MDASTGRRSRGRRAYAVAALVASTLAAGCTREPLYDEAKAVEPGEERCLLFGHEHAAWSDVLARYVRAGVVSYTELKRGGRRELEAYLGSLESVCQAHYATWTREQRLAFWINA